MTRALLLALAGIAAGSSVEKTRPVVTVVNLLKKMQKELEGEKSTDNHTFERMQCWCKKEIPDAQKGIEENDTCVKQETALSAELAGKAAKLEEEIVQTAAEIAEETESLDEARNLRNKASNTFAKVSQELSSNIGALENAIDVLAKHERPTQSFLQLDEQKPLLDLAALLSTQLNRVTVSATDRKVLESFVQQPSMGAYESQSGQIFGILQNMLDTFRSDLSDEEKKEAEDKVSFEKMELIKQKTIQDLKKKKTRKTGELAKTKKDYAASQANFEACTNLLGSERQRFEDTKQTCEENIREYQDRSETRNSEIEAVGKALEFLDGDEARDLFNSAFGFLQLSSKQQVLADNAMNELLRVGKEMKSPQMLILAQKIKGKAFVKVIRAVDELVAEIKATIKKDIEKKDSCIKSINSMKVKLQELNTTRNALASEDPLGQIPRLEEKIDHLGNMIKKGQEKVADSKQALNEAAANRKDQNALYQKTVTENNASVNVLEKAKSVLSSVFAKKALLQQEPGNFGKYKKNAAGGTVIEMINNIIKQSKQTVEEMIADENKLQESYEKLVETTNTEIDNTNQQIDEWQINQAQTNEDLETAREDLKATLTEIQGIEMNLEARQEDCAFLLTNFELRERHMRDEISALLDAKQKLENLQSA